MAIIVLDAATGLLPDDPVVSIMTPLRILVAFGLIAVMAAGGGPRVFRTRLDVPIGLLLGAATASTVLGGWSLAPVRGLLTTIGAYYLFVALRRIQAGMPETFAVLALVAVATAGTAAITQVSEKTPTGFCRSVTLGDAPCRTGALVRAVGTFANPNLLAAFLLLFVPFAMLATVLVPDRARIAVTTVVVMGYTAVLATYSRAGFVAGSAGLLVLAATHWRPRLLNRRPFHLVAALSAAGFAAISVLIAGASRTTDTFGTRSKVWAKAIDLATAHPLGVGLGRAGVALSVRTAGDKAVVHAHNLWLNWLVETGAGGMIALTIVTTISVVSAAELARRGSITGKAGLAALTGFLLMNMVDHPTNVTRIATAFWGVLGIVMGEMPARWRDAPRVDAPYVDAPYVDGPRVDVPYAGRLDEVFQVVGDGQARHRLHAAGDDALA